MTNNSDRVLKPIPKKFEYMKEFIENCRVKKLKVKLYHDTICKCKHDAVEHPIADLCLRCNCKSFRPIPIDDRNFKRSGNPF